MPEPSPVHPLHDRFAKDFLHDPEDAADVFQCALPASLVKRLAWDQLCQEPCEFITEFLGQKNSDLLFSLPFRESRLQLFLIFEHFSHPDRDAALRASEYKNCCHRQQQKKGQPPGPVLCVILYHGKEPWRAAENFSQWLNLSPEEEAELGFSMAPREYLLLDVSKADVERLKIRAYGKMVLSLLKSATNGTELEWLKLHQRFLDELLRQPERSMRARTLIWYCLQAIPKLDYSAFQKAFGEIKYGQVKTTAMSFVEMLEERGRVEGLEKGLLIGRIQAFEQVTKQGMTHHDELTALSLEQLQSRLDQLEKQLFGKA